MVRWIRTNLKRKKKILALVDEYNSFKKSNAETGQQERGGALRR